MEGGEVMPRDYTPDGRNLSPPLAWSNLPEGTQELALVCADFGAGNPPPSFLEKMGDAALALDLVGNWSTIAE